MRRIPRYRNFKQRSRAQRIPQASIKAIYCFLESVPLWLNLNEPQTCRTEDTVCIFLYMLAYAKIRPLGIPEGVLFVAPNQGNFLQKTLALVGGRQNTSGRNYLTSR